MFTFNFCPTGWVFEFQCMALEQKNIMKYTNTDSFVIVNMLCVLPHLDQYPAGYDTRHSINTEWVFFTSYNRHL